MIAIEPKFSEALQGASVCNCYLESGFSGKGETRMRGRRDMVQAEHRRKEWNSVLAAYESSKTRNVYILSETNSQIELWLLKDGEVERIKDMGFDYDKTTKCQITEMRFLNNKYVEDYKPGSYGILLATQGRLWVLDDLDPLNEDKFQPMKVREDDEGNEFKANSVCVVANRIIVSEANTGTWLYSSPGATDADSIEIFGGLNDYDAEYSGDNIVRVARVGGIRLAVFGESTLEIWDISGDPDDPFTTSHAGQVYKIGCMPESIMEINDTVYFCGIEDMSYRHGVFSIDREGLQKISEPPLDALLTQKAETSAIAGGKYSENANNFYLLHFSDPYSSDNFSIAYCIQAKAFSKFFHQESAAKTNTFNCFLSAGKYIVGLRNGIFGLSDEVPEYTKHYANKMLVMPVYDNGGKGRFIARNLIIDMLTITTPRANPPDGNSIIIDYSPDGTDTFVGKRSVPIPEAGCRNAYPLKLWGLGLCNNLRLRIATGTCNFILNKIFLAAEECL
jgi:hypothetical protein